MPTFLSMRKASRTSRRKLVYLAAALLGAGIALGIVVDVHFLTLG